MKCPHPKPFSIRRRAANSGSLALGERARERANPGILLPFSNPQF
jgi:hypothetical protein